MRDTFYSKNQNCVQNPVETDEIRYCVLKGGDEPLSPFFSMLRIIPNGLRRHVTYHVAYHRLTPRQYHYNGELINLVYPPATRDRGSTESFLHRTLR